MTTKVITARVPLPLAEKVDQPRIPVQRDRRIRTSVGTGTELPLP